MAGVRRSRTVFVVFVGLMVGVLVPTALANDVTPTPASVDFGTVQPGVATASSQILFTNPFGQVGFVLGTPPVRFSGADANDFSVTATTCSGTLVANGSCTADIALTATSVGTLDAVAELVSPGGLVFSAVPLSATGVAPASSFATSVAGFPSPEVRVSSYGAVTLTNRGFAAISLGQATLSGSSSYTLGSVDTCSGQVIPAGGSCGVQVVLRATAAGAVSSTLTLSGTGLDGPVSVPLSATAKVPTPEPMFVTGRVPTCHRLGNGWKRESLNINVVLNAQGHMRDIIPPFNWAGGSFNGRNWTPANQRIYSTTCAPAAGSLQSQVRPPTPPVQQSVTLCHADGAGRWTAVTTTADSAFAVHGRHADDVIPPFSIGTFAGPLAFPGQNWNDEGRRIQRAGCVEPSATRPSVPAVNVTLCAAPVDGRYARITLGTSAALAYARKNPTAIVPPFSYRTNGVLRRFAGLNWRSGAQIFNANCVDPRPPAEPIIPSVQCVETAADGTLTAYFDVASANRATVSLAAGPDNLLVGSSTTPPGAFAPGTTPRALTATGITAGSSVTWSITYGGRVSSATASSASPACAMPPQPQIDIAIFVSCVQREGAGYTVVFGYLNGGGAAVTLPVGAENSVLIGKETTSNARDRGQPTSFAAGRVDVAFRVTDVPLGATAVWVIGLAPLGADNDLSVLRLASTTGPGSGAPRCTTDPPTPTTTPAQTSGGLVPPVVDALRPIGVSVTCVRRNGDGTFDAVFGYSNPNTSIIHYDAGPLNDVTPKVASAGLDQGQTTVFLPGTTNEAWTASSVPAAATVTWRVGEGGGAEATAGVIDTPCAKSQKSPLPPQVPVVVSPPEVPRIGVFVQCVSVEGRTFTAVFGYESDGSMPATVRLGSANRIAPAPARRGQPEQFEPGRHPAAFTISGIPVGRTITWRLKSPDGSLAIATAEPTGPDCVTERPTPKPVLEVLVPPQVGPSVVEVPQTQPIVVTNKGTTEGGSTVVVVPTVPGQTATPLHISGSRGTTCRRTARGIVIRVPSLAAGSSARCIVRIKVTSCDSLTTTVRASASARLANRAVTGRAGGSGGRVGCRYHYGGVTG